jgi:phosphoserine phosphatase
MANSIAFSVWQEISKIAQSSQDGMTRIILVRHGETAWNKVERFRGRADVPLNDTGISQADLTSQRIKKTWPVTAVYSSPLSRALRTAEAIAGRFSLGVQKSAGLIDIDYGRWQGMSPDEVRKQRPDLLAAWYTAPQTAQIPEGESLEALRSRCADTLRGIETDNPDTTVVIVSHTVINRMILLISLGLPNDHFWRLRQDTCAVNVIEVDNEASTLVSMNDTCHLHGEAGL